MTINLLKRRAALCVALFGVILTVWCFGTLSAAAQVSFGHTAIFNEDWLFSLGDRENGADPSLDDSAWRALDLPHDWTIEGTYSPDLASGTGYLPGGIGWYRKHFNLEKPDTDLAFIYFEGVYNRSDVWLNGHHLGNRPNGYASFMYELTPFLKEGDNVLAVRVDHSRSADSRYYTGSGIYRDVYIITAPETHISQWGVAFRTMSVKKGTAWAEIDVTVDNPRPGMKVSVALVDEAGKTVATASAPCRADNLLKIKVADAKLWDIDSPYLYTLRTSLIKDGKQIDGCDTKVGIRTLDFDPDRGFFLNGHNRKVKGVCIHHDAGSLGAVVPEEVWERRLRNLKELGANALRMSHNPQAPVVYDLADRLGFLVMDEASDEWEFPKRKWIKGWNNGEPGFDGTYDFFEEWIDRDVADMVRRDRNHPSVFLWSIGNEVDYPNDPYSHPVLDGDGSAISQPMYGGYNPDAPDAMRIGEIAKRLAKVVKSVDTSRPVTGALAGVVMSNQTAYPEAVDVVGYNYTEDRYAEDHAAYPGRIIYGSENRSDFPAWKTVRDNDFIFGQFIWTGIDYLGEARAWPSRGLYTGLLDLAGNPKPRGRFRASLWSDTPVTYIGTYPKPRHGDFLTIEAPDVWNYQEGDSVRVVCYTNAPSARLLLDGNVVGSLKPMDDDAGMIHWDIIYSPGELKAEGIAPDGTVESDYSIRTSGRPYAIVAHADKDAFHTAGEVAHVQLTIVDENGVPVQLADNEITVSIEGNRDWRSPLKSSNVEILGLESGSNTDMTDQRDNRQRVYRGKLMAYVRSLDGGNATLKFTSPLLQGAEVTFR